MTVIFIPLRGISNGDQQVRTLYNPISSKLLDKLGSRQIRRASRVETGADLDDRVLTAICCSSGDRYVDPVQLQIHDAHLTDWWVDLTPCFTPGAPSVLGPFSTREEALAAEQTWLLGRRIPLTQTQTHDHHC